MQNCIYIQSEQFEKSNLQPIREIIEAGMRGEKKKIATLGASVSKGEGVEEGKAFLNIIQEKWLSFFPESTVPEFINASVSGTFSGNAMFSMEDLIKKKPDLVFLDYSVNDPGQYYLQESFEGLVHHFLESGTYVCILLFCNNQGHCTRGAMTRIAHYYNIPILDIGGMVMQNIREERFSWDDYASDYVHPRIEGHEFIAENIMHFFTECMKQEGKTGYQIPKEPCFDGSFWDFEKVEDLVYDEQQVYSLKRYCSLVMAEFFLTPDKTDCKVDIFVDGKLCKSLEMYCDFSWNNRIVDMVLSEHNAGWHTIEIRPADGKENSWDELRKFNIKLGIGCLIEE